MTSTWRELLTKSDDFIKYLEKDSFFSHPYSGQNKNVLVTNSAATGIDYATNDSFDKFDDWESVSDTETLFPQNFEWKRWIDHNLNKNNYFDISSKNFNGADIKWTRGGICLLTELMHRDIRIILNCYANEYFPKIWSDILDAYLHDGFPCGWSEHIPQGKLVVFSNQ